MELGEGDVQAVKDSGVALLAGGENEAGVWEEVRESSEVGCWGDSV